MEMKKEEKKGLYTSWGRPTLIQQIGPATKNPPPTCTDKIPLEVTLPLEEKQKKRGEEDGESPNESRPREAAQTQFQSNIDHCDP